MIDGRIAAMRFCSGRESLGSVLKTTRKSGNLKPRSRVMMEGSVSGWELRVALGLDLGCGSMAKRSQNVGIVGKYGTCYGAPLGKVVKKI